MTISLTDDEAIALLSVAALEEALFDGKMLARLEAFGLVQRNGEGWQVTDQGQEMVFEVVLARRDRWK